MEIKVLGAGCSRCQELERRTRAVLAELGIEAQVRHVTDMREIMRYRVLQLPALVVDEEVKLAGRLPGKDELAAVLAAARK